MNTSLKRFSLLLITIPVLLQPEAVPDSEAHSLRAVGSGEMTEGTEAVLGSR